MAAAAKKSPVDYEMGIVTTPILNILEIGSNISRIEYNMNQIMKSKDIAKKEKIQLLEIEYDELQNNKKQLDIISTRSSVNYQVQDLERRIIPLNNNLEYNIIEVSYLLLSDIFKFVEKTEDKKQLSKIDKEATKYKNIIQKYENNQPDDKYPLIAHYKEESLDTYKVIIQIIKTKLNEEPPPKRAATVETTSVSSLPVPSSLPVLSSLPIPSDMEKKLEQAVTIYETIDDLFKINDTFNFNTDEATNKYEQLNTILVNTELSQTNALSKVDANDKFLFNIKLSFIVSQIKSAYYTSIIAIKILEIANANITRSEINKETISVIITDNIRLIKSQHDSSNEQLLNKYKDYADKMNMVFIKLKELLSLSNIDDIIRIINEISKDKNNILIMTHKIAFFKLVTLLIESINNQLVLFIQNPDRNFKSCLDEMNKYNDIVNKNKNNIGDPNKPNIINDYIELIKISNNVITFIGEYNAREGKSPSTLEKLALNLIETYDSFINYDLIKTHLYTSNPIIQNIIISLKQITTNMKINAYRMHIGIMGPIENPWRFFSAEIYKETLETSNLTTDLQTFFKSSTNNTHPINLNTLGRYGIVISRISIGPSKEISHEYYNESAREQDTKDALARVHTSRLTGIYKTTPIKFPKRNPDASSGPSGGLYFNLKIVDLISRPTDPTIKNRLIELYPFLLETFDPNKPSPSAPSAPSKLTGQLTNYLPSVTCVTDLHISMHDYNKFKPSENQSHIKFKINNKEFSYILNFLLVKHIRNDEDTIIIESPSLKIHELARKIADDIIDEHTIKGLDKFNLLKQRLNNHIHGIRNAFEMFFNDFTEYLRILRLRHIQLGYDKITYQLQRMEVVTDKTTKDVFYQKYLKYKTKYLELLKKINKN
jgi:hypothetical protein